MGDTQTHNELMLIKGLDDVVKIYANESAMALDAKGKLHLWGPITNDKIIMAPQKLTHINTRIASASMGKHSYSAIDTTGMVWVWGENK